MYAVCLVGGRWQGRMEGVRDGSEAAKTEEGGIGGCVKEVIFGYKGEERKRNFFYDPRRLQAAAHICTSERKVRKR